MGDSALNDLRAAAVEFPRKGHVRAERLEGSLNWSTARGSTLEGNAGDWVVSDGDGVWTVVDQAFQANYAPDGDRWSRTGSVLAVQVERETNIPTLEGSALALPGDWICWYPSSPECWTVSAERFADLYLAPELSAGEQQLRAEAARALIADALAAQVVSTDRERSPRRRTLSVSARGPESSSPTRTV